MDKLILKETIEKCNKDTKEIIKNYLYNLRVLGFTQTQIEENIVGFDKNEIVPIVFSDEFYKAISKKWEEMFNEDNEYYDDDDEENE